MGTNRVGSADFGTLAIDSLRLLDYQYVYIYHRSVMLVFDPSTSTEASHLCLVFSRLLVLIPPLAFGVNVRTGHLSLLCRVLPSASSPNLLLVYEGGGCLREGDEGLVQSFCYIVRCPLT